MAERPRGLFRRMLAWLRRRRDGRHTPPPTPRADSLPSGTPRAHSLPSGDLHMEDVEPWANSGKFMLEPHLRVAYSLLDLGDPALVFARTGIRLPEQGKVGRVKLPLHIGVNKSLSTDDIHACEQRGLTIPKAYWHREGPASLRNVTGFLKIKVGATVEIEALRTSLLRIVELPFVTDLRLPSPLQPCDAGLPCETHSDLGLPRDRRITIEETEYVADGKGVVIGIIDDGCPFAHWNFLRDGPASRLLYIWDQGRTRPGTHWQLETDYDYGYELANFASGGNPPPLDGVLATHWASGAIDEEAVYRDIDMPPYSTIEGRAFNPSTHGAHVMDIAAGNGRAMFGRVGVAPEAEIIFVQLPPDLVAEGGPALTKCVTDGADYICARVKALAAARGTRIPVAINISYGNYIGSHDGLTPTEQGFDDLLKEDDRAIVLSAGNGFAAQCHAKVTVSHGTDKSLRWQVPAHDESINMVEFWYTGPAALELYVTPPGRAEMGPVKPGQRKNIFNAAGNVVGYVDHVHEVGNNNRHQIVVVLHPTSDGITPPNPLGKTRASDLAPAGTWRLRLSKTNHSKPNRVHAWIERDEMRHRTLVRRVQSRFHEADVDPKFTVTGLATGLSTIAVGAFNAATREMAEYSACGPTRPYPDKPVARRKPEVCAPSASDARGRGVTSAAARFALRTRLGGTSASAPHVAGLAALVLQINHDLGNTPLGIDELRQMIEDGADAAALAGIVSRLRANRHQTADEHQRVKQGSSAVWKHLVGGGRAHVWSTLELF